MSDLYRSHTLYREHDLYQGATVVVPPVEAVPSIESSVFDTTPQYIVQVTDISGAIMEEIPAKNLQYTLALNDGGSCSFALPLYHQKTTRALLEPGARNILIVRNDELVWGGRLWTASTDAETAEMQFGCNGWFSLLLKRYISDWLKYNSTDQLDIAWNLINYTQGKNNGNLNITRASTAGSGRLRDITYLSFDRKNIGEALQELAALNDGFDFEITPDLRWKTYYPSKGQAIDYVFETGKNIRDYSVQYDASNIENELTGMGDGEGKTMKLSVQSSNVSQLKNGLMQGVRSFKDVKKQVTLDDHTIEELRLVKNMMIRPEFSLVTSDPPFGAYKIGDTARVRIDDGYNQLDDAYRITTMTVAVADSGFEAVGIFFDDQLGA